MESILAAQLGPILWGLIALALVIAGAILAGMDPELVEVYFGNPRWFLASTALAIAVLVTVVATRPDLAHSLRGLLAN